MKNTNKKILLIEIISLILVVGLIGGGVALVFKGLKKAEDKLDEAFGEYETAEPDTGTSDTSTDSSAETVPADDTKLTFAEGEVYVGGRPNSSGVFAGYSFYCSSLKANTKYKISWSIKSTYGSYGFYFQYKDQDGVSTPYAIISLSPTFSYRDNLIPDKPYESAMMNNFHEFTTDSNGYVEIMLLACEGTTPEVIGSNGLIFESLINYVEIEEVT